MPLPLPGPLGTILIWDGSAWIASSFVFPISVPAGDIGKVLTASATGIGSFATPPTIGGTKRYHYAFGANTFSTGNNFPMPFFTAGASAQRTDEIAQFTGVVKNLYVTIGTPVVSADNLVCTVLINGVVSLLAVTVNTGASGGSNLVNTPAVNAGDGIGFRVTGNTVVGRILTLRAQFFLE